MQNQNQNLDTIDEGSPRDPVAQRMVAILEACAERRRPTSISALVKRTGLAKSTVHRMSWKMAELGVLTHDEGGFSVGTKLAVLGNSNPILKSLRSEAIPYLVDLQRAAGASQLALLSHNKVLVVDGLYTKDLKAYHLVGASMPIHCTATGKALLAKVDSEEQKAIFGSLRLSVMPNRKPTTLSRLTAELEKITACGYAVSVEEFQSGITALAAAFRLGKNHYAAIGTLGSAEDSQVLRSARRVVEAATELEAIFSQDELPWEAPLKRGIAR